MSAPIAWRFAPFAELSLDELYELLQLRQRVFVVEQACPFLDADGLDARAWHLLGFTVDDEGRRLLGAYVRIFGPGIAFAEPSIGRVVTHPAVRRRGLGRALMDEAIRRTRALAPGQPIRIGAQRYLERFYEGLGFVSQPDGAYVEDDIPHVEMVLPA